MELSAGEILRIKERVRERDGYRCIQCGMTDFEHVMTMGRTLDVHRLVPGSVYTVRGCVTLCRMCHGDKPKSPRGSSIRRSKRSGHTKKPLNVWINESLRDRFAARCAAERRNLTTVFEHALKLYLGTNAGIDADESEESS